MDRARLDGWLARAILALLIGTLIAGPLLMGALRQQDFFWLELLGVAAGILWIPRVFINPELRIFCPPMLWPAIAFGVYAVIRYSTADLEYIARKELILVLFYLLFFVLCLNHFQSVKGCDIAIALLLTLAMVLSVFALVHLLPGTNTV